MDWIDGATQIENFTLVSGILAILGVGFGLGYGWVKAGQSSDPVMEIGKGLMVGVLIGLWVGVAVAFGIGVVEGLI